MSRTLLRAATLALTLVAALAPATVTFAADGEPDSSFGAGSGAVELDHPDLSQGTGPAVTQDAAGRLVVAQAGVPPRFLRGGRLGETVRVWRLQRDGTPDPTFDGDGAPVDVGLSPTLDSVSVLDVVTGADGVIRVVAIASDDGIPRFVLIALPASGVDPVFEVLAPDHAAGDCTARAVTARFTATRLETVFACGSTFLQPTYRLDGTQLDGEALGTLAPVPGLAVQDIAVDTQGRVLVLASGWNPEGDAPGPYFFVFRPGDGDVVATGRAQLTAIDAHPDGGFVVAGPNFDGGWQAVRFDAAGAPVDGFGEHGTATVLDPRLDASPSGVAHVTVQPDGRVVLVGSSWSDEAGEIPQGGPYPLALLRLTAAGAPDPTIAADGLRFFETTNGLSLEPAGAPIVQDDNALVVLASTRQVFAEFAARGAAGSPYVGVFRIAGAPVVKPVPPKEDPVVQPEVKPQPQPQATATPTPVQTTVPSRATKTLRSCLSRRAFTIRLRPKALRSATVTVAGKPAKVVRRGGRLTATVDLRKLVQATFSVQVVAKDAKGRTVRETRRYRTCRYGQNGPKVKGGSVLTVVQG